MSSHMQRPVVLSFGMSATSIAAYRAGLAHLHSQKNRHFLYEKDEDKPCAQLVNKQSAPIRNVLPGRHRINIDTTAQLQTSLNASTADASLVPCLMEDIIATIVHSACTPVMSTSVKATA